MSFTFAQIVDVHTAVFFEPTMPTILRSTTGPRGSLGFDGVTNKVIQVSYYSRLGDILFDTNSCGDAYCRPLPFWSGRSGSTVA